MRIIDVDAHLHEPLDWVERTDPALAAEIGPPARFMDVAGALFGVSDPAFQELPEPQRPTDPYDSVVPGFLHHLEITDTLQPERSESSGDDPFYDADARLRFCDERGIDVQFLNPTFLVEPIIQVARARRLDLLPRVRQAWNRWASDQVEGHTDRLIPVTQIDLHDISWSIAEMTRMREAGSRAFAIPEAPVGGGRGSGMGRSITHPDFDPLWSAAEDLGMAAIAHVGFARERINRGWANNGRDDLYTFSLLSSIANAQSGPVLLLAAMVYDEVFERHPDLTVVVEEVGIDWLPYLLASLDRSVGRHAPELDGVERGPSLIGDTWQLPLAPSEYVRRQVRVTNLAATQPLHPVIDVAPELLCFSSDYPHVEGTDDAVAICERQLATAPAEVRANFFGGIGELISL
jgi:predicted TIM-barrel fold metal-dependent hydrolase